MGIFLGDAEYMDSKDVLGMIGLYTKNVKDVWFGVACEENRVYGTSFAKSREEALSCLLAGLPFGVSFEAFPSSSPFAEIVLDSVRSTYDGKASLQDFQFASEHLSEYNRKVLEVTSKIPVGYVASYGAVAKAAGGSARSVGNAMASNPFAPIVPCHRVVKSDFTLGGYGGGPKVKHEFLAREKRGHASKLDVPVDGKILRVYPVEMVLATIKKK